MRFRKGEQVGPLNPRWAGDNPASKSCGRQRARRLYPGPLVCEIEGCDGKAERHHKDDNTANNDRSNIAFLCHKHHVQADGRMRREGLRNALRAARAGRPLSPEHRAKIGAAHKGMKRSESAKAAMSAAMRRVYESRPKPTHCPQGHEYDDANTYVNRLGRRSCRACARARSLRNYYAKRESAA